MALIYNHEKLLCILFKMLDSYEQNVNLRNNGKESIENTIKNDDHENNIICITKIDFL